MLHIDYAYCNTLVFVRHYHIDPITAPAPYSFILRIMKSNAGFTASR